MIVKFKRLEKDAIIPEYAHPGDAGMDFFSLEEKILNPGERYFFATGLSMEIPKGYVGLIWEKSGLAAKNGVALLGGVIDSGYRGEVGITLLNTEKKKLKIEKGQKIAQMLIQPVVNVKIIEIEEELSQTSRGTGGFGSSGMGKTNEEKK